MMKQGKKEKIENLWFRIFFSIAKQIKIPVVFLVWEFLEMHRIRIGLRPIGRDWAKDTIKYTPFLLSRTKQYTRGLHFIKNMTKQRIGAGQSFEQHLQEVLFTIVTTGEGRSVELKQEHYELVLKNRTHQHFRW